MEPARRLLILLALLSAAALGVAACGGTEQAGGAVEEQVSEGEHESEAAYLDIGPLKYQVQFSRQLNRFDAEDQGYLQGIPEGQRELEDDQVWFGVWLRVENLEGPPARTASSFAIKDTQGETYHPIALTEENAFRYEPRELEEGERLPAPNTPAGQSPIGGALLLFKLDRASLENRPLEFEILSPGGRPIAHVPLDV